MDNVKYHSRFIEKAPIMNMKKDEIIAFMSKHDIEISNPIEVKLVFSKKFAKTTLKDSISLILWLKILSILFYRLNLIEMVWTPLRHYLHHLKCLCK